MKVLCFCSCFELNTQLEPEDAAAVAFSVSCFNKIHPWLGFLCSRSGKRSMWLLTGPSLSSAVSWESLDGGLCAGVRGAEPRSYEGMRHPKHAQNIRKGGMRVQDLKLRSFLPALCCVSAPTPAFHPAARSLLEFNELWGRLWAHRRCVCTFVHLITSESSAWFRQK